MGWCLVFSLFLGCAGRAGSGPDPIRPAAPEGASSRLRALVASPDRSEEDRAIDRGRRPAEFLAFLGLRPGQRVADLGAGRGYTTELLARAVGEHGVVYSQNAPAMLQIIGDGPWTARLAKPVNQKVVRVDLPFEAPLPPEARDLDLVVFYAVYHDTVWQGADRARMNRAVFAALKPGGRYVVVDSSARPGSGLAEVKTLHRIDEQQVRDEVTQAGFRLQAESALLRNPSDTRDWNAAPRAAGERRGTGDRFILAFIRP